MMPNENSSTCSNTGERQAAGRKRTPQDEGTAGGKGDAHLDPIDSSGGVTERHTEDPRKVTSTFRSSFIQEQACLRIEAYSD